jgi:hypothetical protein
MTKKTVLSASELKKAIDFRFLSEKLSVSSCSQTELVFPPDQKKKYRSVLACGSKTQRLTVDFKSNKAKGGEINAQIPLS